ncbi:UDP-glucose dehydrogenase family protein [Pseudobacteriovorax antillogorgiicola]|uniref:UDP-glucose 6-dehydrogenase n=1 Tax=Pseudobacteriovorax antillogorgiicola TaxID=1513793 RepID=A0A1Y6BUB1_9BACT|nr:UDP-glucose/GDP-mannose dehydrogenase family protein [Pseudobacteriovorax antillogorgiicola]TCS53835.1 UDP-glucose dehydrogenase [Pseudobacteriovorax antillogorgiicola]SMF21715.1 UDP-glucose dehydrogenase [Pseudobacteriovorax antillogorgiicola]
MRVVMVGTGYVGLVSGTCLSEVGHNVACVDLNEEKIKLLKDGTSPIYEPGLENLIRRNMEHDRLTFTTRISEVLGNADVAFIAVGTPEGEDGSADVRYVEAVAESIGKLVERNLMVVVKSTVPVGTCDLVEETIQKQLAQRQSNVKVTVASNPEFLKEGDAIGDFMKPDRIIVGLNDPEGQAVFRDLYGPFVLDDQGKLLFMDRRSSELTKYGANSMLATRISFMNELSLLCERLGADIDKVRQGIGTDPRIGKKFLYAGPGYGGSCFPKDVAALLKTGEKNAVELEVLNAVTRANVAQKNRAADKIIAHFKDLNGKRIAVWGLAFKPGTDDVREAPAKTIIQKLLDQGAYVVAHDPQGQGNFAREFGDHERLVYADSSYEALRGADAMVLVTEWSEYRRPNWDKAADMMAGKVVFDLRNQYQSQELHDRGYHYECMGRPDSKLLS